MAKTQVKYELSSTDLTIQSLEFTSKKEAIAFLNREFGFSTWKRAFLYKINTLERVCYECTPGNYRGTWKRVI